MTINKVQKKIKTQEYIMQRKHISNILRQKQVEKTFAKRVMN